MANIHISISAEPIFHLGNVTVTNSMATGLFVSLMLFIFSFMLLKRIQTKKTPKGVQNFVEIVIENIYSLTISVVGEEKAKILFPLVTTFFLYILISNWIGLLPGVGTIGISVRENGGEGFVPLIRPASADINATLGLALISVIFTQVMGFRYQRLGYLKRFFNFKNPMVFIIGILELISEFTKIISFAFRLFGNIFAGEVLLSVSLALLPFLAPLPFLGLEVFVGLIQALVFAMLTLVFTNIATLAHEEQEHS